MPGSKLLLDTNAAIALIANDAFLVSVVRAEEIYLPYVSVGELFFGAYKSARITQNVQVVKAFVATSKVVWPSSATPELFGTTKAALRAEGRPIPDNDLWIAALALQYRLPVVTRDAHFQFVAGLTCISW